MSELTNLTDRLTHLRDRKGDGSIIKGGPQSGPGPAPKPKRRTKTGRERKFAPDTFMIFVYGLLAIALVSQIILIFWLDVV
jgi:hypothetical protein